MAIFTEKMVDFWCYLLVLMIGLKVFTRVARWIFVSNGGFTEIPIKSGASVIPTKSTYCIFLTIIPKGCEVDFVWRKMVVCSSTLANIFSPEYPSGGERGSFSGFSHQSIL